MLSVALVQAVRDLGYTAVPFKAVTVADPADVTSADPRPYARPLHHHLIAAGLPWSVDYNPVVVVPTDRRGGELHVLGRAHGRVTLSGPDQLDVDALPDELYELCVETVSTALERCRMVADVVVVEGAGDAARPSARRDLANAVPALHAGFPVAGVIRRDRSHHPSPSRFLCALRPDVRALVRYLVENGVVPVSGPPAVDAPIQRMTMPPVRLSEADGTLARQRQRMRQLAAQVVAGPAWSGLVASTLPVACEPAPDRYEPLLDQSVVKAS